MKPLFSYGTLVSNVFLKSIIGNDNKEVSYKYARVRLPGYRRLGRSVIVPSKEIGATVHGVLIYGLSESDITKLDAYEGHPALWERQDVKVFDHNDTVEAQAYIPQEMVVNRGQSSN